MPPVTGRQESPGYISRVGKRFATCSRTNGLYCKDLKLRKEEGGERREEVSYIYTAGVK
jgi:hypothetical protein